jgi:hypothetical protein
MSQALQFSISEIACGCWKSPYLASKAISFFANFALRSLSKDTLPRPHLAYPNILFSDSGQPTPHPVKYFFNQNVNCIWEVRSEAASQSETGQARRWLRN